jgi:hypothetical protein
MDPNPTVAEQPTSPTTVRHLAEEAIAAWKTVVKNEKYNAEDLYYWAEELWCEEKHAWANGKRKVLRGQWTCDQFDEEMEKLNAKQKPVWDILLQKEAELRAKYEAPHQAVVATNERIKECLQVDPVSKKYLHPAGKVFGKIKIEHPDQHDLHHAYHCKLQRQFEDAEEEYQTLCGYPSGLLTEVKLFREHLIKENAQLADYLHKKKGVVHSVAPTVSGVA